MVLYTDSEVNTQSGTPREHRECKSKPCTKTAMLPSGDFFIVLRQKKIKLLLKIKNWFYAN
jgi:hypothetical protein